MLSVPSAKFQITCPPQMPVAGGIFPSAYGAETIRTLRDQGFKVVSVHVMGLNRKLGKIDDLLRFCKDNGIKYAVFSFMEGSVANIRKLLPALSDAAKKFREEGMWLLIHNHAQEWQESEGTSVMEFLAEKEPELGFELDARWTEYAGVSSVEAMKRLRMNASRMHKEICIVALTANAISSAKEMFMREGFDGFVSKPIELTELERVMKRVLPRTAFVSDVHLWNT